MAYRLFLTFVIALSGCSKLADYSADLTTVPDPVPSPSVTVSVPDPIHEWEFENNANDSGSLGGWVGTLQSGTYSTPAKVGSDALVLSGSAEDFFLGSQTLPAEMTVACWVNWTSSAATVNTIIANSVTGSSLNGIQLYVQHSGNVVLVTGNGTSQTAVTSTASLTSGTYMHVVATFDQVLSQSAIYINGNPDQSGGVESAYSLGPANTYLGIDSANGGAFKGELDDCRIYNVALSAAQVALLYNSY